MARERLWRAQTPQGFRYPAILAAHRAAAGGALSDDAAVAERAGLAVALTAGDEDNLKITTERDFARAERILAAQEGGPAAAAADAAFETRVGMGFDVHRFGPGDHLMLCGVRVPHAQGVIGHSDGDVGLHAIVDAVLGAIAAGDIGTHFPPSGRGLARRRFRALRGPRAGAAGGARRTPLPRRCHAGLRAAQDRPAPAGNDSRGWPPSSASIQTRISLKATTTERLGFTGRGEGIAAQAVATVRLPAATWR